MNPIYSLLIPGLVTVAVGIGAAVIAFYQGTRTVDRQARSSEAIAERTAAASLEQKRVELGGAAAEDARAELAKCREDLATSEAERNEDTRKHFDTEFLREKEHNEAERAAEKAHHDELRILEKENVRLGIENARLENERDAAVGRAALLELTLARVTGQPRNAVFDRAAAHRAQRDAIEQAGAPMEGRGGGGGTP